MQGIVFNIQWFSLFDGSGIRTVVFLKGCPLRCLWCHNPEGLSARPQIMFNSSRCIGCGDCTAICRVGCHVLGGGLHSYDRSNCEGCGACAGICCTNALSLSGTSMSAEQVMESVMRDATVYRESGGGLTVSGGEPFMQADFTVELLRMAKEAGINTCVETSGYGDTKKIREAARYLDTFLFDYKATGEEMHRKLCGVSQEKILSNLAVINELGIHTVLRCPIVPGLNDITYHIEGIAAAARNYDCIAEIQLMPYHRLGISKADQLGMVSLYEGQPPAKDQILEYYKTLAKLSKKVTLS